NLLRDVFFGPDGGPLACVEGGGVLTLRDPGTGAPRREVTAGQGRAVYAAAFSPDGKTLALGGGSDGYGGDRHIRPGDRAPGGARRARWRATRPGRGGGPGPRAGRWARGGGGAGRGGGARPAWGGRPCPGAPWPCGAASAWPSHRTARRGRPRVSPSRRRPR